MRRICTGWVETLQDHEIVFTGKVLVDGAWTHRIECRQMARARGARAEKTDFSGKISLVVHGELASQVVQDEGRHYSQTLVLAQNQRARGKHVCVVDGGGFSDLLAGYPARCRQLRSTAPGSKQRLVLPVVGDGALGGPIDSVRRSEGDSTPPAQPGRGTSTHEAVLTALNAHLRRQVVLLQGPARRAPRFDAGWTVGDTIFVAEVKALDSAEEDQQLQLGIGQVLDYIHQLERLHPVGVLQPVVVLERRPGDEGWASRFAARQVLLTWGPDFPSC